VSPVAVCAPSVEPRAYEFPHVLDGVAFGDQAARLAKTLDRGLLDEAGWDPMTRVLALPAGHRLLGRKVCRVPSGVSLQLCKPRVIQDRPL
jgi:hypothetical protein